MGGVGGEVNAATSAIGQSALARELAHSCVADKATLACVVTGAAVVAVALDINTVATAVGLTRGAIDDTRPHGADLTGGTGVATYAAVRGVGLKVGASTAAIH